MRLALTLGLLALLQLFSGGEARAASWTLRNGVPLAGDPISFDFGEKTVTLIHPLTGKNTVVPTEDLSLRSRQQLLFSPLFRQSSKEDTLSSDVKTDLLLRGLALLFFALFIGFWISGWLIGRKANPLLAGIGFLGSWAIGAIFTICYAFLKMRLEGGVTITLIGVGFTLIFTPLFVSAVYGCPYLRGLAIFSFHLVAGLSLLFIGVVGIEILAGEEKVDAWWRGEVFAPLGLMESVPRGTFTPPGRDSGAN